MKEGMDGAWLELWGAGGAQGCAVLRMAVQHDEWLCRAVLSP